MKKAIKRFRNKWHRDLERLSRTSEVNLKKAIADSQQSLETTIGQIEATPPLPNDLTFCCPAVSSFFLALPFHHIDDAQVLSFCCEMSTRFPHVKLAKSGKETIKNYLQLRRDFLAEGAGQPTSAGQSVATPCLDCPQYQLGSWKPSNRITMVHFSMTPAPCQGKCIYCDVVKMPRKFNDPESLESYERAFRALEYAEKSSLIASDASWLISSGEITIHPLKEKIYSIVESKNVTFFTNAFIFDEEIARIMFENPQAKLELSIDSGTAKSWLKIKQKDNFTDVIANLKKYYAHTTQQNQIILKYIFLPGLNDTPEDYEGIIRIMGEIGVTTLTISRERRSYELTDDERSQLIDGVIELATLLNNSGFDYSLHSYSPTERRFINSAVMN